MMCEQLSDPAFGSVSHSGTSLGSTAEYSCNSGYNLSGVSTRTCLDPGTWSGNPPTCERECFCLTPFVRALDTLFESDVTMAG